MKKSLIIFLSLFFVVFLSIFILFICLNKLGSAPEPKDPSPVIFIIHKNETGSQVASDLESQKLIKNALAFRIYLRINGINKMIFPGEYKLSRNLPLKDLVATLLKGPVGVWVTIPEGIRREQIAEKIISALELNGDNADSFRNEFMSQSKDLEGYLFPDTYIFLKDAKAESIISKLKETFDQKTENLNIKTGLSLYDTVILASIVERETGKFEENPIVAGILLKRLNAGWLLQADATVQYAIGTPKDWWPNLTQQDLDVASPFNTYKSVGLPPSPIANPGLEALKAAANPKDSPYWYYLHDSNGQIHYAKSLEEHTQNINKYLSN
jgi:UPF0755 protein